jgi:AcrR family transcriptional regulator
MAGGRPRSITEERIVEAGIALTLPELTVAGIATQMGVTVASIYKYVEGIEGLRLMVAEGIMARWSIPPIGDQPVEAYLAAFSESLRRLVGDNPGIARFLTQVGSATPVTFHKIDAHHAAFAQAYGFSPTQTAWLLTTVVEHAISIADMIHVPSRRIGRADRRLLRDRTDLSNFNKVIEILPEGDAEGHFRLSMRALITGVLIVASELP